MGKDLEIGVPRISDSRLNGPNKTVKLATTAEENQYSQLDLNQENDGRSFDEENLEMNNDKPKSEWIKQAMNSPGKVEEHRRGNKVSDAPPEISKIKDKGMQHVEDMPSLVLSLKRLGDIADTSTNVSDQNIVGRSELSAFTRYAREGET